MIGEDGRLEAMEGWKDVTDEIGEEIREVLVAAGEVSAIAHSTPRMHSFNYLSHSPKAVNTNY